MTRIHKAHVAREPIKPPTNDHEARERRGPVEGEPKPGRMRRPKMKHHKAPGARPADFRGMPARSRSA